MLLAAHRLAYHFRHDDVLALLRRLPGPAFWHWLAFLKREADELGALTAPAGPPKVTDPDAMKAMLMGAVEAARKR